MQIVGVAGVGFPNGLVELENVDETDLQFPQIGEAELIHCDAGGRVVAEMGGDDFQVFAETVRQLALHFFPERIENQFTRLGDATANHDPVGQIAERLSAVGQQVSQKNLLINLKKIRQSWLWQAMIL